MQENRSEFHILVAVGEPWQLSPLLTLACMLTRAQGGRATLLCVTPDGAQPDWLRVPDHCNDLTVRVEVRADEDAGRAILHAANEIEPDLLMLGWRGEPGSRRYLLGSTLDPVTRYAPCDVAVVRADELAPVRRVLVPAAGGPNATRAIELALQLSPEVQITALNVVRDSLGPLGLVAGREQLESVLEPWRGERRVAAKVARASGIIHGILAEAAAGYDMLLIGASNESYIDRKLFGNVPQTVAAEAPVPTIVVRRRVGPVRSLLRQMWRRISGIQGQITADEQVEAYREVRRGARARPDFFVLIALAAAIAALGLLMNSPAVIIGAMVIAPLMSAIFGISLGVVQGDARLLWQATSLTLRGAGLAILVGALVGWIVPLDQVTPELLSRTQPTLLDLFVALVSGTAGAYAQCRRSVLDAVAGVAIAVALVPPLATAGIGITMGADGGAGWAIASGALLLFMTNLSAIAAVGSLVFLFFGFRPEPGRRILVFGRGILGVLVLLIAVSVPLTLLTVSSIRSNALQRSLQAALIAEVEEMGNLELVAWQVVDEPGETLRLDVRVRASRSVSHQEAIVLQERVALRLQRPIVLVLSVSPVTQLDPIAPQGTGR